MQVGYVCGGGASGWAQVVALLATCSNRRAALSCSAGGTGRAENNRPANLGTACGLARAVSPTWTASWSPMALVELCTGLPWLPSRRVG